jgi:hypothetical protein
MFLFLQSLPIDKLSLSSTSSPAFVYMRTFDYVVRATDVLTITKIYISTTTGAKLGEGPDARVLAYAVLGMY